MSEGIKLNFFSIDLNAWIDLNLRESCGWISLWVVGCHRLWYWRNIEICDMNDHRPSFSGNYVQRRVDEYGEAMKNNVVAARGDKTAITVGWKPSEKFGLNLILVELAWLEEC